MTVGLNAAQSRAKSQQDMIVYDECTAIMKAIITASGQGHYEAIVNDNTTMTASTPIGSKIGTVNNPVINPGDVLILNNSTITLGASGTNLNAIIADINDAAVPGVTARKDNNYIVLDFEVSAATAWQYEINQGSTASLLLGLTEGMYTVSNPPSVSYFNSWQGVSTSRAHETQMAQVEKYFTNLGYKVTRTTNTLTQTTFVWNIFW
jgi:hypothetical protein